MFLDRFVSNSDEFCRYYWQHKMQKCVRSRENCQKKKHVQSCNNTKMIFKWPCEVPDLIPYTDQILLHSPYPILLHSSYPILLLSPHPIQSYSAHLTNPFQNISTSQLFCKKPSMRRTKQDSQERMPVALDMIMICTSIR